MKKSKKAAATSKAGRPRPAVAKASAKPSKAKPAKAKASAKPAKSAAKAKPAKPKKQKQVYEERVRILVPYEDAEGITVVCDAEAIARRYADGAAFEQDAKKVLCAGMNAQELVAFGTHDGGRSIAVLGLGAPFEDDELRANGMRSRVRCGLLRTSGKLVVTDWPSFAGACAENHGLISAESHAVAPGLYAVTVYRSVGKGLELADGDKEPGAEHKDLCHLVELTAVDEAMRVPPFMNIPGADGWF